MTEFTEVVQAPNTAGSKLKEKYLAKQDPEKVKNYTEEANKELDKIMNSKYNFITTANKGIRVSSNEAIQSLFNLTMTLSSDGSKMTASKDIKFA